MVKLEKIKILIADDQELMSRGLQTILELEADFQIAGTAANGEEACHKCRELQPHIVLMDIRMPVMDGVEATGIICGELPQTKVIVLTTFDDDELIINALKAGAATYLLKDIPSEKLIDVIRRTYNGDVVMQPEIAAKLVTQATHSQEPATYGASAEKDKTNIEPLTKREQEVLTLMSKGLSNKEIAENLFIGEGTVKNHISIVYSKLGVKDRTQAVLLAFKEKLV